MTTFLDHPIVVRVERPSGSSLGGLMSEIRSWLDGNGIKPLDFRPAVRTGLQCELKFAMEKEAELFRWSFSWPYRERVTGIFVGSVAQASLLCGYVVHS